MNKEIIKKYKEAFNHWLDGGKVWLKWSNIHGSKWKLENYYDWREADRCLGGEIVSIVQDDEYVEFRKEQADGKTIQWKNQTMSYPIYEDIKDNIECYTLCSLRIKPDKPTAKIGDFMRHPESMNIITITSTNLVHGVEHLIPWEPQEDEWCWFWNSDSISLGQNPLLGKYSKLSWSLDYYDHCEPFIGTLPTILKDK